MFLGTLPPMDIVFETPSEAALLRHQGTGGKYLEWAIALRDHEGQWAVLPDEVPRTEKSAAGTAQNIRRGKMKGFTAGEYDAVADGIKVFVKFTGAKQPTASSEPKADDDEESDQKDRGPTPIRPVPQSPPGQRRADPADVRRWAITNGLNVPARGRMADDVWTAYEKAVENKEKVPGY